MGPRECGAEAQETMPMYCYCLILGARLKPTWRSNPRKFTKPCRALAKKGSEIRRSLENAYRLIEIRKDLFAKRLIAKAAEDAVCCQAALQATQEGIVDLTNSINQEPGSEEICTLTVPCGDQYWSPTSSGGSLPESWKGTAEEDDEDEKGSAAGQSADHIPGRISISRLPPTGMESPPTGMEPPTPTYSPDFEPREEGRPQIKSSASSTAADFRLRLHELESLQKLEKLLRLLVMQQLARHR